MPENVDGIFDSAYLAAMGPLIRPVIESSLGHHSSERQTDGFARSFLARLIEQGALIPNGSDPTKILGLTLIHHVRNADHPVAWFNLAIALRLTVVSCPNDSLECNQQRLTLAADACMNSISRSPTAIRSWTELGIIRHLLRQPAESLAAFERGLEVEPDDIPLWLWKAFALQALGRRTEALEATKAARRYHADQGGPTDMDHLFESDDAAVTLREAISTMRASIEMAENDFFGAA